MRSKDPELIDRIYSFVDEYYHAHLRSPSLGEIAGELKVGKTTAYRYITYMDEKGLIDYDGAARTISTRTARKYRSGSALCPIVGSIPCGSADEKEASVIEYVSLPTALFGKGSFYILRASGDSMTDEGIENGDIAVIRTDAEPERGDIIAALINGGESTLKVFGGIDEMTGEAILRYRNESRYPGREIRVKNLCSQGVLKYVIKKK